MHIVRSNRKAIINPLETIGEKPIVNDTKLLLKIEAQKKSVLLAALMNFFVPGAATMWCGKKWQGIAFFVGAMVLYSVFISLDSPQLITFFAIGAGIGGAIMASRYNKTLIMNVLGEEGTKAQA